MSLMGPLSAMAVVVALLLSGCAGAKANDADADVQTTSVVQASAEALSDAGSVEGLVVDDAVNPIQGATVALEGLPQTATTDEGGTFQFTNLAPGSYKLFAAKLGFESSARAVSVVAGESTKVTITLTQLQVDEAYVDLIVFKLFMACGGGLIVVTFTGGCQAVIPNHRVVADHNVTKDLETAIAELVWTATSGFSSKSLRLVMGKDETGGNLPRFTYPYGDAQGPSPVKLRADAKFKGINDQEEDKPMAIRDRIWVPFSSPDPPVVILVLEQPMTLYSSMFYGEEAAEDYSAIPDQ